MKKNFRDNITLLISAVYFSQTQAFARQTFGAESSVVTITTILPNAIARNPIMIL